MQPTKKFNNRSELLRMVRNYVAGTVTEEEKEFLETYYDYFGRERNILDQMSIDEKQRFEIELEELIMGGGRKQASPIWSKSWVRIAAAASVLFVVSIGLYFYLKSSVKPEVEVAEQSDHIPQDITPGGNKAVLTLADGSQVILDDAANGEIAEQAGISISKQADGTLIYTASPSKVRDGKLQKSFNTIETPRGGEYQINLPDGTKVWLNSVSSLRYPTGFGEKERRVELKGEAYFEVASNKNKPFLVESNHQVVEVLGTHFNINSYEDETAIKTTLMEGEVKVSIPNSSYSHTLKPGQQSTIAPSGNFIRIQEIDTQEAIAWKNGYFIFANEDIQSIMRKISRWYNVDVEYVGRIPTAKFGGNVSRAKNISEVLRVLELTKAVHFKIEGRRVTVMP